MNLFSQVSGNKTRGNGLKLYQRSFRLVIRKKLFIQRIVKHWNRLHRKAVESLSLKVVKGLLDVSLRDMV